MSARGKRTIKFKTLFKTEATEKDIKADMKKMLDALKRSKLPIKEKADAVEFFKHATHQTRKLQSIPVDVPSSSGAALVHPQSS